MATFTYGTWSSDSNEVTIDIIVRSLDDPTGYAYGYVETWVVRGIMQADDLSALVAKQDAMRAAFLEHNKDATWVFGATTAHQLTAADSLYGVKVVTPPHFPQGGAPGELVNRRQYTVTLEAAYLLDTPGNGTADAPYILNYESQTSYTGTGGAVFGHIPTLTGTFQRQILTEKSLVTVQQSGMKLGLNFYPTPDAPPDLWAPYEKVAQRQIRYGNPRKVNNISVEFPVYWNYTYERNEPFPALV